MPTTVLVLITDTSGAKTRCQLFAEGGGGRGLTAGAKVSVTLEEKSCRHSQNADKLFLLSASLFVLNPDVVLLQAGD